MTKEVKKNKKQSPNEALRLSGLGMQMLIVIGVFIIIGFYIDKTFNSKPLWTLIFSFLGTSAGFYQFVKSLPKP
jgi:F0F1-type ATP synthase assembly protein I